jgi:hypothetical protein
MDFITKTEGRAAPWNKGKLLGQKPPLKLREMGDPDSVATGQARPRTRPRVKEACSFSSCIGAR